MLRIMLDTDRLRTSEALIGRICTRAGEGVSGQILIVPEQYSHTAERALCRTGGGTISRYAEVLSFTRLASRLFSIYGGVCEEYLDKGGRLLSVYLAAEQVRPQLKYYAAVSTKPEFLQRLGAAMEEFLSCCLAPEALREAARSVSGQFAQKLEELAILYESYLSVCKSGRQDPVTRLQRAQTLLQETDFASEHIFYLDGFADFTAVERQILSELLRRSPEVVLALTTDGSGKAVFRAAGETLRWLKKETARWNVPMETCRPETAAQRAPELGRWLEGLFAVQAEPIENAGARLRLHQAASAEKECEFALWSVRRLLEGGCRCRELAVAYTDRAAYEPALRTLFARAGLPAYFAGNHEILREPVFAALLAAMEAVERYDYEPVLTFLKSGLGTLEQDACDRLERYAYVWNIHGAQWEESWTMHPAGYGAAWDDRSRAELEQLEQWRAAAVAPLAELKRGWRTAQNVGQMLRRLDEFLDRITLADRIDAQAAELEQAGEAQSAQQTRQLYDILIGAMEQMDQVLGACVMQPQQFTDVFRMLLGQYQVGSIPASVDQVQVGGIEAFRSIRTRHLIVLGAEEGKLPAFAPALGIFTDEERQRLLAMGLSLAPAQEEKLDRELGWIYAALSAAEESCTLCCSGAQPSFLFDRTQRLSPDSPVSTDDQTPFAADAASAAAQLLQTPPETEPEMPALREAMETLRRRGGYDFAPLGEKAVRGLYGAEIALSASRIDRFASCRYAFFLYDGLRLRPWKQARFDAPVFGTFVHFVLEHTVREVMERGGFAAVSEQALMEIAGRHAEHYTKTYLPDFEKRGERFAYLFARNMREAMAVVRDVGAELRVSAFRPCDEELSFAPDGALPPVRVRTAQGDGVISGFVDRVDLYETKKTAYFRVVDYKTGRKDFDYADILCGEGLQMLIYLFALQKNGEQRYGRKIFPAGVLYVPAREDMERIDPGGGPEELEALRAKHRRRKGLVLRDEAVLQAMEPSEGTPQYLPYQVKKGELTGDLAGREQLEQLERFVMRSVQEMTGQMLTGRLEPNPILRGPMHSSCMYCDFAQACHRDSCKHANRYIAAVKAEKFWEELERRERHG